MTSMRSGYVAHICVFCHHDPEQTYQEYQVGVSNAKGEKYLLTFPESLMHYLKPDDRHDWKLNYHSPQWFIDDLMDPATTFIFPPGGDYLETRSMGYLTSLKKMSEQYDGVFLRGAEEAISKHQFGLDEIVDTHGTDGNVNHGTLAVFKTEPLPKEFYENLSRVMNYGYSSFQFEKYLDSCCEVEFNSTRKFSKPLYNLAYDDKHGWTLTYLHKSLQEKMDIGNIPELRLILEKFANIPTIPLTEKFDISDILKKHHCLTRASQMLPEGLNPVTFKMELRIEKQLKITIDRPHLDSDTESDLSSTTDVSVPSQKSPDSLYLSSPSLTKRFFISPSSSVSSTSSTAPQSEHGSASTATSPKKSN